jgi:hypothetical protein
VDWQNRYSAKENEAKMLTTQLNVLTNVIQTQGLNLYLQLQHQYLHQHQPPLTLPLALTMMKSISMVGILGEPVYQHGATQDPLQ